MERLGGAASKQRRERSNGLGRTMESSGDPMSMSDMLLVFFEEGDQAEGWARSCFDESGSGGGGDSDEDGRSAASGDGAPGEGKAFWEAQHQLLQDALSRNSSVERRVRVVTEEALGRMQAGGEVCRCSKRPVTESCRNCALRGITQRLQDEGYDSAVCKSKWRRSPDIPSGEHSYVDVVIDAKGGKKGPVRVVIELNFRGEFEMARASQEYNGLVSRLPEAFVGKSEKLRGVIKIMCAAAKRCMKENRMHMGPWRKHKYMQSKWLGTCERRPAVAELPVARVSDRQPKLRASMLTFDLHRTVVEVG